MTLAEFELRAYAYRRQQQWDWAKYRSVSYWAVRAFNIAPKSIPKKLKDMMLLPFVDKVEYNTGLSEEQMEGFRLAQLRYLKQKEQKELNGVK